MLHMIRGVDRRLLWLNLLLLPAIVFLPFPAGLLGQRLFNPIAVAASGAKLIAVNVLGSAMWLCAGGAPPVDGKRRLALDRALRCARACRPIVVYAAGKVLARWCIPLSILLFAAVPTQSALDLRLVGGAGQRQRAPRAFGVPTLR